MTNPRRQILVTGANKGIGRSVCGRILDAATDVDVILTARNSSLGEATARNLAGQYGPGRVRFHPLDVTDASSIQAAAEFTRAEFGGLDALVNNAGVAAKGSVFDRETAEWTLATNFYGVRDVTDAFRPLLRHEGRVVNVSSRAGVLSKFGSELQERFLHPSLNEDEACALMREFVEAVEAGTWKERGWPGNTYAVSKAGLNALTAAWAREWADDPRRITVNACSPGWVRTDMTGPAASLTEDEGAETPMWLALGGAGHASGGFYFEKKPIDR